MTEKEFKKTIRKAIEANEISTYSMTKQGVNHNTYKRWQDGKGSIKLNTALKLCDICDLKLQIND